jgi:hypothetical protein
MEKETPVAFHDWSSLKLSDEEKFTYPMVDCGLMLLTAMNNDMLTTEKRLFALVHHMKEAGKRERDFKTFY